MTSEGPKRILALDGGGIRGALTVVYNRFDLARIGEAAASRQIKYEHFTDAFNLN